MSIPLELVHGSPGHVLIYMSSASDSVHGSPHHVLYMSVGNIPTPMHGLPGYVIYCSILFNSYVTCHTARFIRKNFVCHGVQKFIRKVSAGSRGRPRIAWDGIRKFSYVTPVIRILRMDKFVSNVTPKTSYELSKMLQ